MKRPNRWSRTLVIALACLVALMTAYGVWVQRQKQSIGGSNRRITVAQFGDFFLYAPLYVAIDKGFFRTQGLDVSVVSTGGDDKTWAAVLSGSAQFGIADPTFVAVSASRGQPGVVVASIVNGVPFWGITFKDIPPIVNPQDLEARTVATFPSPSTAYALQRKMFTDAGLTPTIREGAFGAIIPMLKAGTADIGLELEPNVSQAVSQGAHIVYSLAERYGDFAITGLTTTEVIAKRDPELVKRMRAALQAALDLLRRDPDDSVRVLLKRFPSTGEAIGREALARALKNGVIPSSTVVSEEAWQKAISLRRDLGDLKSDAPYATFVWPSSTGAR